MVLENPGINLRRLSCSDSNAILVANPSTKLDFLKNGHHSFHMDFIRWPVGCILSSGAVIMTAMNFSGCTCALIVFPREQSLEYCEIRLAILLVAIVVIISRIFALSVSE